MCIRSRWIGVCCGLGMLFATWNANGAQRPNVLVILCDDLGYGDVRALNPDGKIETPHMDRLARDGVIFTDAHSASAVCTPTRYALLTGRYNWRTRLQNGVLGGMSPRLIEPNRATLASLLHEQGYHTACIGKWHLGLNWQLKSEKPGYGDKIEEGPDGWNVDFSMPFRDGPCSVGFDTYFGISASLDMVPYTFLRDDRVVELPTVDKSFPMMHGRPNGKTRPGPAAADFDAKDVLPALTRETLNYLEARAEDSRNGKPFFLYLPLASPHTPIVPTEEWLGRSGLNTYADFVMQTDDALGQILAALDRLQLAESTLVVFTSDNGCSPQADFPALEAKGHHPSYIYRGNKADIFEGGHRVPYIARWPNHLKAGSRCEALVGLQDTAATVAQIVGIQLAKDAAVDSFSWWSHVDPDAASDAWPQRESLVHHSINGSFAIREGEWKLCFCGDSGGWSDPRPNAKKGTTLPPLQLFNLKDDPGERNNVAADNEAIVRRLTDRMAELIEQGRSTPGPKQANTVPVKWNRPK